MQKFKSNIIILFVSFLRKPSTGVACFGNQESRVLLIESEVKPRIPACTFASLRLACLPTGMAGMTDNFSLCTLTFAF